MVPISNMDHTSPVLDPLIYVIGPASSTSIYETNLPVSPEWLTIPEDGIWTELVANTYFLLAQDIRLFHNYSCVALAQAQTFELRRNSSR